MITKRRLPSVIADLHALGAVTEPQAARLADRWRHLPADWAADPYLRSVREHSRAYLDEQRLENANQVSTKRS